VEYQVNQASFCWGAAVMTQTTTTTNVSKIERRKHWQDRRMNNERRNPVRIGHMNDECRSDVPRRDSDIAGKLVEGERWWSGDRNFA